MTTVDTTNLPVAIESLTLRAICSQFVTGVTVITTGRGEAAAGTTVNSFTSVSLDPPLVLFCLHRESRLRPIIETSKVFVVNFLAGRQQGIAWAFAGRGGALLAAFPTHESSVGTPILSESLAFLGCRLVKTVDAGDHLIFLGEVVDMGAPRRHHDPLIFFRGSMRTLDDSPVESYPILDG